MIGLCANYALAPDLATATAVLIRNTIAAQSLLAAVEKALELTTSRMGKSAHRNRLPFRAASAQGRRQAARRVRRARRARCLVQTQKLTGEPERRLNSALRGRLARVAARVEPNYRGAGSVSLSHAATTPHTSSSMPL